MIKPKKNTRSVPHTQNSVFLFLSLTHPQGSQPLSDEEFLQRCSHHSMRTPLFKAHHYPFFAFLEPFTRNNTIRQVPLSLQCQSSDSSSPGSVSVGSAGIKYYFHLDV